MKFCFRQLSIALFLVHLCGCSPQRVPISKATQPHPDLTGKSLQEITELFNRKKSRENIYLSVTLWDRAFIEAFLKRRAVKKNWTKDVLQKAIDSWAERFLKNKTSFRIRLEALHRPLTIEGEDPLLNLESWRWELWDSEGNHLKTSAAKTESKKVFEGSKGRQSFRIDGNIHFTYTIDPSKIQWIRLLAIPPGDEKELELEKWVIKPASK